MDDRYASRKFILAYALVVVAIVLVVLIDKNQFAAFALFALQIFGMYAIANVATKVATKP